MSKAEIIQDFFELGDRTSLICVEPDILESTWKTIKELGFKTHIAEDQDDAVDKLRYNQYHCIVIQENFDGGFRNTNMAMNYLAPMTMAQRRNSFVCLIGNSFKTSNAPQAFAQSVHIVVNPSDLPNLTPILKKGLAEFESMYRIFRIVVDVQGDRREMAPKRPGR